MVSVDIKHHVYLLTNNIFDYKFTCGKRVISTVFLLDLCRQVTCVACEDKTVSMFDTRGKRLLPPLMLGSQVSIMKCAGQYVMAVTSRGYLYIWSVWSCMFVSESCVNVCFCGGSCVNGCFHGGSCVNVCFHGGSCVNVSFLW